MKNRARKGLSLLLAIIMMLSMVPAVAFTASAEATALAESEAVITVDSVSGKIGNTVTVNVAISENPGILCGTITVSWNDKLTLVSDASGEAFSYMTYTKPSQYKSSGTNFVWAANEVGEVVDGTILTLTFEIADTAHKDEELEIEVSYVDGDVFDGNENPVVLNVTNGSVRALGYLPGDITGDGRINMLDVVRLSQYISDGLTTDPDGYDAIVVAGACDVTGDGRINMLDVVRLSQYISDGLVTDPAGYNAIILPGKATDEEHILGEWVVVKDASETEEGLQERTCSCGGKDFEVIPKLEPAETDAPDTEAPETEAPDIILCDEHTVGTPVYNNSVVSVTCENCGDKIWTTTGVVVEKYTDTNDGNGFTGERKVNASVSDVSAANAGGYVINFKYKLSTIANPNGEVTILSAVAQRGTDYFIPVFLRQAVVNGELVMKIANSEDAPYFKLEAGVEYNIVIVVDPTSVTEHAVFVNGAYVGSVTQDNKVPSNAESVYFRINDQYKNQSKTFIYDFEVMTVGNNFVVPEPTVVEDVDCANHTEGTPVYSNSTVKLVCDSCGEVIWKSTGVAVETYVDTNDGNGFTGERKIDTTKSVASTSNKGGYAIYFRYRLGEIANPQDNGEVSVLSVVSTRNSEYYVPVFLRQAVIDGKLVMKIANAADAPYFELSANTEYEIFVIVDPNGAHAVYVDGELIGTYTNTVKVYADADANVYFRINDSWKNKCKTFVTHFEVMFLNAFCEIPEIVVPAPETPETEAPETEAPETEAPETEPAGCDKHVAGTPIYRNSTVTTVCENCGEIVWTTTGVVVEKYTDTNDGNGFTGERKVNASVSDVSAANAGGYVINFKYKLSTIANPDGEVTILSAVAKRGTDYFIPVFLRQAVVNGELVMKIANSASAPYFKLEAGVEYNIVIVVDPTSVTEHAVFVNGAYVGSVTQDNKVPSNAESVYFRINDQYKNKSTTFIYDFEVMTIGDDFVLPEGKEIDCDNHTVGTPVYADSVLTMVCNECGEAISKSTGVAVEKIVDTNGGSGFTGERPYDANDKPAYMVSKDVVSKANSEGYAIYLKYALGAVANPDSEVSVLSVVSTKGGSYYIPIFLRQAVVDGELVMKIANAADAPYFKLTANTEYEIVILVDPNGEHTVYVDGALVGSYNNSVKIPADADDSAYIRINDGSKNKSKTFINHLEVLYLNVNAKAPEIVVPVCEGHTLSNPVYEGSKIKMYCEICKAEVVVASKVAVEKQNIDNGDSFIGEKTIVTDANVVSTLNENGYVVRFNYTVDSVVADGEVSVLSVVGYGADKTLYIPIFLRQYPDGDGVTLRIQKGNANAPGVKLFAGQTYEIMVFVDVEDDVTTHSVYVDGKYLGSSSFEPENDHRVVESDVAEGVHFRINDQYKNKSRVHVTDFEVLYTKYDFVIGDEAYVDGAASYTCDGHTLSAPTYADSAITMHCEACGKEVYIASVPASEKWTDTNDGNGFNGERQIATSASVVSKLNSDGYVIRFNYKLGEITAPEADVAVLTLVSTKGNATYTTPCFIRQYPDGNGGVVFRIAKDENAPAFTLTADTEHDIMIFVNATNSIGMMEYFVFVDGAFVGSYEQLNEVVTDGDNYYFRINDQWKNKTKIYIKDFEVLYLNGEFDVKNEAVESCEGHNISAPTYLSSKITAYCYDCQKNIVITGGVGVSNWSDYTDNSGKGFTGERKIDVPTDLVATDDGLGYAIRFKYNLTSIDLPTDQDEVSVFSIVTKNADGGWVIPVFLRQFSIGGELYLKTKGTTSAPGFKLEANKEYDILILVDPTNDAGAYVTAVYVNGEYLGSTAYSGSEIITSDMTGCYIRINDSYRNKCYTQIKDLTVLYMNADYNVLEGGDPWEVATDAVNTWLERWEVIKQGGDKNADTLDYGNHYEKIDNYNFATNSYYEYRELSWVRKADGSYTRNISRLVSTLKNYTYNNNETNYYDVYGGYTANGQIAEATGYFYTTKIGDRWWTVDPLGYPFFRTAMNEVTGGVSPTQKDNVITKHGTLAAWAESATEKLQALGFNSMGAWSDVANLTAVENSNPLTETRIIGVLSKYASSVGINTTSGGSTTLEGSIMPVFDPAFETLADWYVYQGTYGQKYNPNVYGWMSDNELPDDDDMLDAILLLENPMNTAYAYTYATAITFLKAKGIENPTVDDLTPEIRREFKAMTYDKYFEVVVAALDKYVPNHQYIGCRLLPENWKQEEFIRVYGYWCDILSINYYGSWTPNPEMIHNWLLWAGKPFISTEWYAMAREDSGLESTSGAGFTVQYQEDRADFYQNYSLALLEFKGCVGFDWFKMWDNDPTDLAGIANDSSNANGNKGIYSTEYNEWTELTEAMAKVNNNKYSLIAFFDARG